MRKEWVLHISGNKIFIGARNSEGQLIFECLEDASPQGIHDYLQSSGYRGEDLLVLLASTEFFFGRLKNSDLPEKVTDESLTYLFEEKLPVSIEDLVIQLDRQNEQTFCYGLKVNEFDPFISGLEDLGISIEWILPKALMLLNAIQKEEESKLTGYILIQEKDEGDLFYLNQGQVESWSWGTEKSLTERLKLGSKESEDELNIKTFLQESEDLFSKSVESHFKGASKILLNFRSGRLEPKDKLKRVHLPLKAVLVSTLCVLLLLSVSFYLKGQDFLKLHQESQGRITQYFDLQFPGQSQPQSVKRRFESRYQELLSAQLLTDSGHSKGHGTLWSLNHFLKSIPQNLRFLILELRISDLEISVSGQARSHSDTDKIVASLRDGGGFKLSAPRTTKQKDGGVSFRFDGQRVKPNPMSAKAEEK